MDSSNTSCVEAPNNGSASLGVLQGQWPARSAAPRSSKLNSVTRAGQQHSTPTRDSPARSHLPSPAPLPCTTTTAPPSGHLNWAMGEGGCQNWPHLNSSGTSLLPRSSLDVAASVQCVEAATGCISSLVASPRGPQSTPSHFSRSSNCMMPKHFSSPPPNISQPFKLFPFPTYLCPRAPWHGTS